MSYVDFSDDKYVGLRSNPIFDTKRAIEDEMTAFVMHHLNTIIAGPKDLQQP